MDVHLNFEAIQIDSDQLYTYHSTNTQTITPLCHKINNNIF